MSTTIDEKVVEMRFDNKDFEKNVQTSINSIDSLKKSLDFNDVNKTFGNLEKASKGLKFEGLGTAVDNVKQKFSAMEVIAVTALANITNSAVNAGKRIVDSLTVAPIRQGFSEYELKMSSVQTIMASTGEDINTVNKYLEELNLYADKTIYSFSDMTASIGKFTNSGVKLDDAVRAIQGVSNVAAVSGANANEASRAMYNFAQALSTGSIKLIDWKSIENANMATVEFKQNLIDTAVALGTVRKEGDEYVTTTTNAQGKVSEAFSATKGFNDALAHQWMTTDVLIQSLTNYSTDIREMSESEKLAYEEKLRGIGYTEEQIKAIEELGQKAFDSAQDVKTFTQLLDTLQEAVGSGWSQSFELIFGNLEEAKKLWTGVSNAVGGVIDRMSTARNELLKGWKTFGGRNMLFEGIANIWNNILNIVGAIKKGFKDIIPPTTVANLLNITKAFKNLTEYLKLDEVALERVRRVAKGVAAVFDIFKQIFSALIGGIKRISGLFGVFSGGILEGVASIGDFLAIIDKWLKRNKIFEKVVNGIIDGVITLYNCIDKVFRYITGSGIVEFFDKITTKVSNFFKMVYKIVKFLSIDNKELSDIEHFFKNFQDSFGINPFNTGIYKFLLILHDIKEGIKDLIHGDSFRTVIERYFGGDFGIDTDPFFEFFDKMKPTWDKIVSVFKSAAEKIKSAINSIRESIKKMGGIDTGGASKLADKLKYIFAPIIVLFEGLKKLFAGVWKVIQKLMPLFKAIITAIGTIIGRIGDAIGELWSNTTIVDLIKGGLLFSLVKKVAEWVKTLKSAEKKAKSFGETIKGFIDSFSGVVEAITGVFDGAREAIKVWQTDIKANTLLKIAAAIAILTVSLLLLTTIDKDKMNDALGAITIMFVELIGALKAVTSTISGLKAKDMMLVMGLMISMSIAILMLAAAIKMVSKLEPDQMMYGMMTIILLLITMTGIVVKLSNSSNNMTKGISGLIGMATAVLILVSAIKSLSKMDPVSMLQGLAGLGAILLELAIFFKLLNGNKPEKLISFGIGLNAIAVALKIMISAVKQLSKLDPVSMFQGLGGLGALLLELAVFFKLIGKPEKMISFGTGMILLGTALTIVASAIKILGTMNFEQMATALVGLGGAMAIIIATFAMFELSDKSLAKVAAGLILFGDAMIIIATAMKILGSMDMMQIGLALEAFAGAMGIIIVAFQSMPNDVSLLKIAGAIIVVANAMMVMALALKIMGTMKMDEIGSALVTFAGAMMIMIIAIDAMDDSKALKSAGAIAAFAGALLVLAPALKIMGSMNFNEILGALVLLGGVFVILGVSGMALAPVAPVIIRLSKAVAILGVGVMALGAGVFLLATGLTALGMSADLIIDLVIGLVKSLIELIPTLIEAIGAGIGAILVMLSDLLPDIGKFLASLLKTVLIFLKDTVPVLAETLLTIILGVLEALSRNMPKIVTALADLIVGLILSLGKSIGKIVNALVEFVLDLIESLGQAIKKYASKIVEIVFGFVIDILSGVLDMIFPWLKEWVTGSIEVAKSIDVLTAAQKENIEKSYAMAAAYRELRDARNESIKNIQSEFSYVKDLRDEYNSYIDSNGEIIKGYEDRANVILVTLADAMGKEVEDIKALIDANGKLADSFDEVMIKMQAEAVLEANKEAYSEAIKNQKDAMNQYISAGNTLTELRNELAEADIQYAAIMDTYNNTMAQGAEDAAERYLASQAEFLRYHASLKEEVGNARLAYGQAQEYYSGTMQELANTQKLMAAVQSGSVEDMKKAMDELQYSFVTAENGTEETLKRQIGAYESYYRELEDALKNGMAGVTEEDVNAAKYRLERANGELAKFEAAHKESGEKAITEQAKAMEDNTNKVVDSETKVINSTVEEGKEKAKGFHEVGKNIDEGTAKGITDFSYLPKNATTSMVQEAIDAAHKTADAHSPSRVFMRLGQFMDMGLAEGIKSFQGQVLTATEDLGNTSIDSMSETVSKLYDYLDSDMDSNPTITPVLDLSQVSNGVSSLNGMLKTDRSLDLSARAKLESDAALLEAQNGLNVNNQDVISTIQAIRKDISDLSKAVGGLQVVMDTGALVGQISSPMDASLGRQTMFRQRGI